MILDALAKAGGIQARAVKLLGISERSLWYRVKKLKIQVQEPR
jgi:transcriptional regulator with GAF, ATPase, and Fis domain